MTAVVYRGARTLELEERDIEPPGPGQVRIDVAYTGICGTDLHIYHGHMDARVGSSAVIGHEMSGRVGAIGGGPVGVLIAAVAQGRGARVVLADPDPYRRGVAGEIGIEAVDPSSDDVIALLDERTTGAGADIAFEVSGSPGGVSTAVDVLATRGRLVMVAIHTQPRELDLHRYFWRELELFGARLYQREDMTEAVRLVASGPIPAERLISRIESVRSVNAAFEALESRGSVMKVLIEWQKDAR